MNNNFPSKLLKEKTRERERERGEEETTWEVPAKSTKALINSCSVRI
jgi:hypothetical protein